MADTTVRVPIKVDADQAKTKVREVGTEFGTAGKSAKAAQTDASSFFRSIASQAIAFNMGSVVSQVRQGAASFVEAGAASNSAQRTMAATSLVLENMPWDKAVSGAADLQGQLASIGKSSGFAGGEVQSAYMAMLEATDGSAAAVARTRAELGSAAKVADAFGMSIETAGREISFMHEGTLRTRGQMFQLLKSTGIFGTDIKKASENWAAMTDADRTAALAKGLEQVASKVEKLPPSYRRLVGQVEAVFAGMQKDIGEPIIAGLVPALEEMLPQLQAMRGSVREIAQQMGPEIGKWIKAGASLVQDGLAYVVTHAEQIKAAIATGFEGARAVVEWILAHKEELAIAFGAKTAISAGMGIANAVQGSGAGGAILGAAQGIGGGKGMGDTIAGLGLLAAAAVAAAYTLNKLDEANQMRKGAVQGAANAADNIKAQAAFGSPEKIKAMFESMRDLDDSAEMSSDFFTQLGRTLKDDLSAIGIEASGLGGTLDMTRSQFEQFASETMRIAEQAQAVINSTQQQAIAGLEQINEGNLSGVTSIVDAYNTAQATHNQAAMRFAGQTLLASGFTAQSLAESGIVLKGGLEEFASNFDKGNDAVKEALGKFMAASGGQTAKAPAINMSGGQSFKINQDFRDQDPDRVAIAFQEGLGKMITRRIGASTSGAFGT